MLCSTHLGYYAFIILYIIGISCSLGILVSMLIMEESLSLYKIGRRVWIYS